MRKATKKLARDYGGAVLAAVIVALLIRFFLVEAYRIPTGAMRPTLEAGDTIFVAKAPFGFNRGDVARGDVVVYESPVEPGHDYIKRVVAIPGETVQVTKGHVKIDGQLIDDSAQNPSAACGRERAYSICWEQPVIDDFGPQKVPPGSVFVLGDLRSHPASETRKRKTWGIIPIAAIKGKAIWIWLSVEPDTPGMSGVHFPNFRFERMFRRIE